MLDWSLKNLPDFIEKISLKPSAISPEERVQLEEYLRCEVVFTVMQLCEDLAIAFETYKYSTADAVRAFRAERKASQFMSKVNSRTKEELADWLSIPPVENLNRHPTAVRSLTQVKEFLGRLRKFYFDYLEMYNCYKHGNRLAYISSPEDDETPYPVVLYFPKGEERNTASLRSIGDIGPVFELGNQIIEISSYSKKNWLTRKRVGTSGNFAIEFPILRGHTQNSSRETETSVA